MAVGEQGGCRLCLCLFLPLHPPPKCRFPLHCSGCLFREAPRHRTPWGLSGAGFPTAWSCFSLATTAGCPRPWPPAALPGVQATASVVG